MASHWSALVAKARRENWPVQAVGIAVSAWLLVDQLYLFLITRPTSNSDEITTMNYAMFPDISVCPVPPYNLTKMEESGYLSVFYYYLGLNKATTFVGWGGSFNDDAENLLEKLTTVSNTTKVRTIEGVNYTYVGDDVFYSYFYTSGDYRYFPAEVQVVLLPSPRRPSGLPTPTVDASA